MINRVGGASLQAGVRIAGSARGWALDLSSSTGRYHSDSSHNACNAICESRGVENLSGDIILSDSAGRLTGCDRSGSRCYIIVRRSVRKGWQKE